MSRGAALLLMLALTAGSTARAQTKRTPPAREAPVSEASDDPASPETSDAPPSGEDPAGAEPARSEPAIDAERDSASPDATDEPATDEPATDEPATDTPPTDPGAVETEGDSPSSLRVRSEDAEAYTTTESSSTAASVLGTATVVFGVVTAGTLGYFLDRTGQVDTCAAAEAFEDSERGCVNRPLLEGQRDTGLGVFLGALGGFAILATSWAIVAATDSDDDGEQARVRCAPALAGVSCAGRF